METSLFRRVPAHAPAWKAWRPYGLAVLCSGLGLALSLVSQPFLQRTPLIILAAAVFVTTWFGGRGPGLLAVTLTAVLAEAFIIPLDDTLSSLWLDAVPLTAHTVVGLTTVAVLGQLRERTRVLREKERELTNFMESATVGMHWLAEDGTILWSNGAQASLVGYTVDEYIGRKFQDFHVEPREAEEILQRLTGNERLENVETCLRGREGSIQTVLLDADVVWREGQFVHARCVLRDVTVRKDMELHVQASETKFRAVFENSLDGIGVSREGRLLMVNPALLKLFGYAGAEQLAGRPVADLVAPSERAVVQTYAQRRERGEPAPSSYESRGVRRNGEEFDIEVDVSTFALSGQRHTLFILRDVTGRKRAEAALRQSEASLRLAQRIGRIGSWAADLQKNTIEWSEEAYRIFGCRPETFTPTEQNFFALVHSEDRASLRKAADQALKHGKYYSADYRITCPNGVERFVVQQARIVRDAEGRPIQMVGTVQDITERRLAEEALRESEERFRILFERSPESIFILDPYDRERLLPILDCNEAACLQHGYERAEFIGQPVSLIDPEMTSRAQVESFVARVRREQPVVIEAAYRHRNGGRLDIESRVSLIALGSRELLLRMDRDISERKKAGAEVQRLNAELEARVQERTRQLEEVNRELEAFSYSISHDLRAPVRAISGFSRIIQEDHASGLDDETLRLFRTITANAQRMGELIDDLLAFSRLNGHVLRHKPINMKELAESVTLEFAAETAGRNASLRIGDLPTAQGDASLVRQVLANLIGNALKYSRYSDGPVVEVGGRCDEPFAVYFVKDNGVGFDAKYAGKLFKVFQRLHKAEQFEGTGVGLAIVQRIVQRHGGRVWAESEPGRGATFYFSLPVAGA